MNKIKLPLDRLTPGLYIQLPCSWVNHPFVFGNFKIKNQDQIKVLRSLGLKYVIYYPDKSDVTPPAATIEATPEKQDSSEADAYLEALWKEKEQRVQENKSYLRNLRKCQKDFDQSLASVRAINLKMGNQTAEALAEAQLLIGDISSKLMSGNNSVLHLMEHGKSGKTGGQYHSHAFHVAILAMILGNALKLSKEELNYLGLGALFHDIGKTKVPDNILNNKPEITTAENNFYKMHVQYGVDRVKSIVDFPEPVREIISQHHEYLDGSGYPNKLSAKKINLLTQIVTIANEFDNMCNPTDKHPARSPNYALSYLYKNKSKQLNKNILGILIKKLGIYPPGSVVQLSDNRIALVISVTENQIMQPNVLIYDPAIPKKEAPIIKINENELKIERVVSVEKLPQEAKDYLNPCDRINFYFDDEAI
ncbi:HD-GYP domain-containing protein [Psychromonas hadalis]|uniref:HD-GYP domain-containing protein n=1 Tax=Psychromonas hadalis TaxID=211669 RepID=UPI0003B45A02|nr:DUF3391 domain-containing protein [Psychromonas hadalis]